MKKAFVFILLLSLIFTGCSRTAEEITKQEDSIQLNSNPTSPTVTIEPKERLETTPTTIPSGCDTVTTAQEDPTTEEGPQKDLGTKSIKDDDSKQEPKHSVTTPSRPSEENAETPTTEATQPENESTPTEPEPSPTTPQPTEPDTSPTNPAPTEPTGCSHDWKTIHHEEAGHWKAGIVCDCGWTVYGNSDEVVSKWNAHSASYPPEESLFEHGGYGSADEWVVDKPAYDERVCRHCGESKS